jgi:hemerythrin-like metal-binding protein
MFEWKPQYSVNIASIDGQHRSLFGLAEELYRAMSSGQGKSVLSKILKQLVDYTKVHFSQEENLMRQNGYPDLAAHQEQHKAFVKKVLAYQAEFEEGGTALSVELLHFFTDWLSQHIANTDQKYVPYVKGKAVA